MSTAILQTKLYVPPPKPTLIARPQLIARLNAGLASKLIGIFAPAGFGKTTLIAEWGMHMKKTASGKERLAWLALDRGDNDPVRFWTYFIAALQGVQPELGADALVMLRGSPPQTVPITAVLTSLINDIAREPAALALVLDDYHLIASQAIHDGVTFVIEHLPPKPGGMTLLIASRTDPPLPLSRWRVREELTELRAIDLAFGAEETAVFLHNITGYNLSAQEITALISRTEGWIAGLQMAALSLQGRERHKVPDFIRSFAGSHHYILDYLTEEVLQGQPEYIQSFLLQTSILDRLSASLCDAVLGQGVGASEERSAPQITSNSILEHLERNNLFLIPLDDERRWYRYHQLFADLLRGRLEQDQPDLVPLLHRRASDWYKDKGQIVEAVGHALASGDVEWIESVVAENALGVIYHGQLATVANWLDTLPAGLLRKRPRLCVVLAWVQAYAGHLDDVEPLLRDAENALSDWSERGSSTPSSAAGRHIAGQIAAVRAYVLALREETSAAAELAREALALLPKTDLTVRGWTALLLGCLRRSQGDLAAAEQAFTEAVTISRAAGNIYLQVDVFWEQAVLQLLQGRLNEVMRTCEEALQIANQYTRMGGRRLPVTGYIYSLMSDLYCERNDLETALRYARQGLELSRQWGQADALTLGCFQLAAALNASGAHEDALDVLQEARQVVRGLGHWYVVTAGAHEARIRLAQGDVAAAARWVHESGLSVNDQPRIDYISSYLTLTRVLKEQGRLNEILGLLRRLLLITEAAGAMGAVINTLVHQALVLQAQGEVDRALVVLERALTLAEPEGYVRRFIGEGKPMCQLLRQAAARGIAVDYVHKLLAAFDGAERRSQQTGERESVSSSLPASLPTHRLIEALSRRELEVLGLLAAGLSNKEIAQSLVIAVGTVKKHLKNIYGKLNVHNRTKAVARARELDILEHNG